MIDTPKGERDEPLLPEPADVVWGATSDGAGEAEAGVLLGASTDEPGPDDAAFDTALGADESDSDEDER